LSDNRLATRAAIAGGRAAPSGAGRAAQPQRGDAARRRPLCLEASPRRRQQRAQARLDHQQRALDVEHAQACVGGQHGQAPGAVAGHHGGLRAQRERRQRAPAAARV
jgi:hypothetical protein